MVINRLPYRRVVDDAAAIVRSRLAQRPCWESSEILNSPGMRHGRLADQLLHELGALIGVHPGCFRSDDCVGTILRVSPEELTPDARQVLQRMGLTHLEPFAFDLLFFVEEHVRNDAGKLSRITGGKVPASEVEWLDLLATRTIRDLLYSLS